MKSTSRQQRGRIVPYISFAIEVSTFLLQQLKGAYISTHCCQMRNSLINLHHLKAREDHKSPSKVYSRAMHVVYALCH